LKAELPAAEDNASDRQRARQSLHMIARYHRMKINLMIRGTDIVVRKIGILPGKDMKTLPNANQPKWARK